MDQPRWKQVNITYASHGNQAREHEAVTHLARVFPAAEAEGLLTSWFFIRKGPWRIRYLLAGTLAGNEPDCDPVHPLLIDGVTWASDIYEPETHAFGGPGSMDAAHQLFHADSRNLLTYLSSDPQERRERSLVLCSALMKAAGLDFNEQGDVWARIAEQRAALLDNPPDPHVWKSFTADTHHLLTGRACRNDIGNGWIAAFEELGTTLKVLRNTGQLTRGIRGTIALHVVFHWNRIGIPGKVQAILARAAKEAVFGND